jgi:hypothetical protein
MDVFFHGTTKYRALLIIQNGPNPRFREPGGLAWDDGFSMYLLGADQSLFGKSETYARLKADQAHRRGTSNPDELIPAILFIENVPEAVLDAANLDGWFPRSSGLIQVDYGYGFEELMQAWPDLNFRIQELSD